MGADVGFENMGCSCQRGIYHRAQCKHNQYPPNERRVTRSFVTPEQVKPIMADANLCGLLSWFANIEIDQWCAY